MKILFKRAYNEKFSKEIFKKSQRFRKQGIPMYTIKEFSNEVVKGNFYESEYKELMKMRILSELFVLLC